MITDDRRIADLEQKVESLELSVTDLRRAVEALNGLIDQMRLSQLRVAARSMRAPFEDEN
jgi:hypothetical protein